jgi:hypothetical protein
MHIQTPSQDQIIERPLTSPASNISSGQIEHSLMVESDFICNIKPDKRINFVRWLVQTAETRFVVNQV